MEHTEYEEKLASAEKYKLEIALTFLAYLVMALSFYISVTSGCGLWFSRSGSLTVILSAIVEYRNITIQQSLNEVAQDSASSWDATPDKWTVPKSRKRFEKFVLLTLVLATLVWGYGDLLF